MDLPGTITLDAAKEAYRKAAKKYHPDRKPAGTKMLKLVKAAYDVLKDYSGDIASADETRETGGIYPEAVNAARNSIIGIDGTDTQPCRHASTPRSGKWEAQERGRLMQMSMLHLQSTGAGGQTLRDRFSAESS